MNHSLIIGILVLSQLIPSAWIVNPLTYEISSDNQVSVVVEQRTSSLIYQSSAPQKITDSLGIETTAGSTVLYDPDSLTILFQKNPNEVRPIASITKLMTALVFLDHNPGFNSEAEIIEADQVPGGNLDLREGERLTVWDLFNASLVGSANNATEALARLSGLSREDFLSEMNQRAKDLGLTQTSFDDVTGLSTNNVSTAYEIARLASFAFNNSFIEEVSRQADYTFQTIGRQRKINIDNTNQLFDSFIKITGSKTGFTNEAGNCLVVRTDDGRGHQIVSVVLGASSAEDRFQETKGLLTWGFENWSWDND